MSKAVLSMSMSLDGFIAGPDDGPSNGLGDGGHRLHEWILMGEDAGHREAVDRLDGVNREVMDEVMSTGAVVVGRRTFEFAGGWGGDHHDELQIHLVPVLFGRAAGCSRTCHRTTSSSNWTGTRWICSSSRTPAVSASAAVTAPCTSTFLSPAASLARRTASATSRR